MHLSRVYIKNFRSIQKADLAFKKGKNIIVGKNNSGKSNVIKAIDLILGENSPTWEKSQNISDNDFFNGDTSKDIFIWCELIRCKGEPIDLSEAKGAFFNILENGSVKRFDIDFDNLDQIFEYSSDEGQAKIDGDRSLGKKWIGTRTYCRTNTFVNEFSDIDHFAFAFRSKKENEKINKDLVFFYKKQTETDWKIGINCNLRNQLLQSAIIPSFRDPKDQLRITHYTWYGKLLKNYVKEDDPDLVQAFDNVKDASNNLFNDLQTKLCCDKTKIAFPNTDISFQFNPDTKQDVYKSTLIYVDDGFNSQLQEKGSGIQSSVVIGLFDFYIREIAHASGSLLAIEEPELYLHPHGRRVISDRLDLFLDGNKNQVIISTHSPEFICCPQEDLNLIVLTKKEKATIPHNFNFSDIKTQQVLIKKQNAEMFFADAVILVEGGEKYLIEEIAKELGKKIKIKKEEVEVYLEETWLNDHNVSIINCGGKTEFWKYSKILTDLDIPFLVISDFDFLRDGLNDYLERFQLTTEKDSLNEIKGKIDGVIKDQNEIDSIGGICNDIGQCIVSDSFVEAKRKTNNLLRIIKKNTGSYKKIDDISGDTLKNEIKDFIESLRPKGLFILLNEFEDNYLINPQYSKEQGVLETISKMEDERKSVSEYVETEPFEEALKLIINQCLKLEMLDE